MARSAIPSKNPLVTVLLMSYNQESCAREAIRSIFDQTYHPLEIILSDDSSSDHTFRIMQQEADAYSGPHKVILNQNKQNLGIAGHLTKLVNLASGELVVYACGDDISLPQRVQRIVDVWNARGRGSILIHSNYHCIDDDGNLLENDFIINDKLYQDIGILCRTNMFVAGATSAYTKDLITDFPDFLPGLVHEDCCTPFRARLMGAPIVSIAEPLILYRQGGVTSRYSKLASRNEIRCYFQRTATDFRQKQIDLIAKGRTDLLPVVILKQAAYSFAERCADSSVSLRQLFQDFLRLRPPFWFSIKQVMKFRLGMRR